MTQPSASGGEDFQPCLTDCQSFADLEGLKAKYRTKVHNQRAELAKTSALHKSQPFWLISLLAGHFKFFVLY
jgi:uncharacterized protein YecT (DUF1311 family)